MQPIAVTPLTTTLAARVEGIDLHAPIPDEAADAIRAALAEHHVLVFPGQPIDLERQQALARVFGPLEPVLSHALTGASGTTTVLDNGLWQTASDSRLPHTFMLRDEFQNWHSDSTYCPQIPTINCLRAEVLPPVGGGTTFAGMACAYDALSPKMQAWLETLEAIHAAPPGQREVLKVDDLAPAIRERWDRELGARKHPLVVRHPVSGRKMLFVNPSYVVKVDGLTNGESAMLLRWLFRHCTTPDFTYRHRWELDDILVWDQLATLHLAPTDHLPHERRVVRVSAGLTTPVAAGDGHDFTDMLSNETQGVSLPEKASPGARLEAEARQET